MCGCFSIVLCAHPHEIHILSNTERSEITGKRRHGGWRRSLECCWVWFLLSNVKHRICSLTWCVGHSRPAKRHTQSARHSIVTAVCLQRVWWKVCVAGFCKTKAYHLQKWTQTLKWGDSYVTSLVIKATNVKNFWSSKPWKERKCFSRQSHHKLKE